MRDPNLVRKELMELSEVLPLVIFTAEELNAKAHPEALKDIHGDLINMTSLKLQTFAHDGVRCRGCGCKGEYFGKEKYPNIPYYHLNLYAMKDGRETQMTKDYIVPLAKGGLETLDNLRTICFDCVKKKAGNAVALVKKKHVREKNKAASQAKRESSEPATPKRKSRVKKKF